jgi:dephospho-CoA kinase
VTGKLVVGLTGGIGSGKSAAADEFERLGATVVDTDAIARELTEPGGAAMPHIRALFGDRFVAPSGAMDRKAMRERVFGDPAARQALEGLLHPMIRTEAERRIANAQGKDAGPYIVYVVPLLVESKEPRGRADRILVVDVPEEVQVSRVATRSGLSEAEVRKIMSAQASRTERRAAADDVIDNSGTLEALIEQVRALHARYVKMSTPTAG